MMISLSMPETLTWALSHYRNCAFGSREPLRQYRFCLIDSHKGRIFSGSTQIRFGVVVRISCVFFCAVNHEFLGRIAFETLLGDVDDDG